MSESVVAIAIVAPVSVSVLWVWFPATVSHPVASESVTRSTIVSVVVPAAVSAIWSTVSTVASAATQLDCQLSVDCDQQDSEDEDESDCLVVHLE